MVNVERVKGWEKPAYRRQENVLNNVCLCLFHSNMQPILELWQ